jgi:hypothetical protein
MEQRCEALLEYSDTVFDLVAARSSQPLGPEPD